MGQWRNATSLNTSTITPPLQQSIGPELRVVLTPI